MTEPAMENPITIPDPFLPAYRAVQQLATHDRYVAALIFGSLARGDAAEWSDVDVKVVVDWPEACTNLNHPIVGGKKLDISFFAIEQLRASTQREIEAGERLPFVAESVIVFDKTGDLTRLRNEAQRARPKPFDPAETRSFQFLFYHANSKTERFLRSDPLAALLVMHVTLNDLLHMHYRIRERWWVSSKRLLFDLRAWDQPLAVLIEQFVATADVAIKFDRWGRIIDHILEPLGGRLPIDENRCDCDDCRRDMDQLLPTT
jgi:predicted nucleotidyltransferase